MATGLAIVACAHAVHAAWQLQPTATVAAGHQDGFAIDPDLVTSSIPEGDFLNVATSLELQRGWGNATVACFTGQGGAERYLGDASRQLTNASLAAELRMRPRGNLRARLEGGGGWFDDSELAMAQRWDAAMEGALGIAAGRWLLEVTGGARGRRHPDLQVLGAAGDSATYTEAGFSGGGAMLVQLARRAFLRAEATRVWTETADPTFDSDSRLLRAAAELALSQVVHVRAAGLIQHRDFRLAGAGHDDYAQVGGALDAQLHANLEVSARWALARYQSPTGVDDQTQRFELGCTFRFGQRVPRASTATPAIELGRDGLAAWPTQPLEPRAGDPHLFRVYAPAASSVALAGDFNHWNPEADLLVPVADGFWELRRALPAGTWQFAYVVDGQAMAPPEASTLVDDGFGGHNGILVVLP